MPWSLEFVEGSKVSRPVELKPGRTVTVGSTDASMVVIPQDPSMAALQFALSLAGGTPQIQNLSAGPPTEVNGAPVSAAQLQPGDRIAAGNTSFVVIGPAPSPYPAKVRLGGWGFEVVPDDWQPVENVGFLLTTDPNFRASITAVEEPLAAGQTLADYIATQVQLARQQLASAIIEGPVPTQIRGAEQSLALMLSNRLAACGLVVQRQIYAVRGAIAGVCTFTMLEAQWGKPGNLASAVEHGLSYFQG